ncbi:hypothetical protein [Yersinia enterocolitica]|uniref:hypothetical protein n=1 Tax=Yersinia enterocolitica TaxID=630 RepID=UPI001C6089C4|nr:hypothetical protein [Yersinia enterocolitica]MBW5819571.1 hypothetical protein [Yersinia enterocolitica]
MYEIRIKIRNVITGNTKHYRAIRQYSSKGKAIREAIALNDDIASEYQAHDEEVLVLVAKVKRNEKMHSYL